MLVLDRLKRLSFPVSLKHTLACKVDLNSVWSVSECFQQTLDASCKEPETDENGCDSSYGIETNSESTKNYALVNKSDGRRDAGATDVGINCLFPMFKLSGKNLRHHMWHILLITELKMKFQ